MEKCQNTKLHAEWRLQRVALAVLLGGGEKGMGTLTCPEFNPILKLQAQAFKEGFKQLMSGFYTSVADACFGFSSAMAAIYILVFISF